MLRQPVIVNCALKAQEEGFDAVVINRALDPGLHQARALWTWRLILKRSLSV